MILPTVFGEEKKKEAPKSEQQSMDEAMKRYIDWAKPKKAEANRPTQIG
jgi:hypothetical protein